jgi:hypothetical protein
MKAPIHEGRSAPEPIRPRPVRRIQRPHRSGGAARSRAHSLSPRAHQQRERLCQIRARYAAKRRSLTAAHSSSRYWPTWAARDSWRAGNDLESSRSCKRPGGSNPSRSAQALPAPHLCAHPGQRPSPLWDGACRTWRDVVFAPRSRRAVAVMCSGAPRLGNCRCRCRELGCALIGLRGFSGRVARRRRRRGWPVRWWASARASPGGRRWSRTCM